MSGNLSSVFQHTRKAAATVHEAPPTPVPDRAVPKSQDKTNFSKTTVYLRKETRKETARKLLDDGRELSEIVNDLLDGWTSGRLEA